jgi:hypothetical protein
LPSQLIHDDYIAATESWREAIKHLFFGSEVELIKEVSRWTAQMGSTAAALSPIAGYDEPGGRTGEAVFSRDRARREAVRGRCGADCAEGTAPRARIFHGDTHVEGKILSLFQPSTEVIRKGKLGKPNEFGKMIKLREPLATMHKVAGVQVALPRVSVWCAGTKVHSATPASSG